MQVQAESLWPYLRWAALLGDVEHRPDLRPRPVRLARRPNSRGDFLLDVVAPVDELGDCTQTSGVGLTKVADRYPIGPRLQIDGALRRESSSSASTILRFPSRDGLGLSIRQFLGRVGVNQAGRLHS